MAEHLLEMAGALVRIREGKIEVLTDPRIRRCPLRQDIYGVEAEDRETVAQILRQQMRELGMYGPRRVLELQERTVSFGASEILADALSDGLVDAAVVVCEGAGTVVISRPEVLAAVGAHMVGLVQTDPIREIQDGLEERGCILIDRQGSIDQVRGFEKAVAAGFQRIAVTVAGKDALSAGRLREVSANLGKKLFILAVHTTGVNGTGAEALAECCDLVWACASRAVRAIVGPRARLQMGISIPVFALTDGGKRLVLNRALHFPWRPGPAPSGPAADAGGKAAGASDLAVVPNGVLHKTKAGAFSEMTKNQREILQVLGLCA